MERPVGIDQSGPWISWEYELEDIVQTGFELKLLQGESSLWESGYIKSNRQRIHLPEITKEHEEYQAVLKLYGSNGQCLETNTEWSTGFFSQDSWNACFITGGNLLRHEFSQESKIKKAVIYFTGLGYCEAWLNGEKISDRVLFPSYTVYHKTVEYTACDVTEMIREGNNVVGLSLAGHWSLDEKLYAKDVYSDAFYQGRLMGICQLVMWDINGKRIDICSGQDWKCGMGPVISSAVFDGEVYDANQCQDGWNQTGFDDKHWQSAIWCKDSVGRLHYSYTTPICVIREIAPVSINKVAESFVVDFGQNFTGWSKIRLHEQKGKQVLLSYGELLYEDGTLNIENMRAAKVTDTYICRGKEDFFEPTFTYHGFRYVQIKGVSHLDLADITGIEVHSDNEEIGEFSCSDPLFNQIYQNMIWTLRSNFFSVPTDCCQRDERQGWMADAGVSSEFAVLNFDLQAFYKKWFGDIRDTQESDGSLPYAGAPGWKRDTFTWKIGYHLCLRYLYQYTGDFQAVEENYEELKAYETYMQTTLENGLIPYDFYNDWLALEFADKEMLANAFFVDFYHSMKLFAEVMNDEAYLKVLSQRQKDLIDAINQKFYGACLDSPLGTGYYGTCDTLAVSPSAMAIEYGIVPENLHKKVEREMLFQLIESRGSIQFPTGILVSKTLMDCLSQIGRDDINYAFFTRKEYPSFGFMIEKDATTIWERWQYLVHNEMNSHNHPALCGMGAWFFKRLCGMEELRCDADGRVHMKINAFIPENMDYAQMKFKTVWGVVELGWHKEDGEVVWNKKIPKNIELCL